MLPDGRFVDRPFRRARATLRRCRNVCCPLANGRKQIARLPVAGRSTSRAARVDVCASTTKSQAVCHFGWSSTVARRPGTPVASAVATASARAQFSVRLAGSSELTLFHLTDLTGSLSLLKRCRIPRNEKAFWLFYLINAPACSLDCIFAQFIVLDPVVWAVSRLKLAWVVAQIPILAIKFKNLFMDEKMSLYQTLMNKWHMLNDGIIDGIISITYY